MTFSRIILQCSNVGLIDSWTHRITNRVMTSYTAWSTFEVTHEEVLGQVIEAVEKSFEVRNGFPTHALEHNCLRIGAHLFAKVLSHAAYSRRDL